ncbi:MAG: DoxX family protein [Candidatus Harrisonbacteria bacterium]|nr:DoxX family protein [Candidatus Harrisonbacteria bacterium]
MLTILAIFSEWALLVLRFVFGAIFLAHGWPKLKNLKANSENFTMMGFKPGAFWGTIVALVETLGGVAIILGIAVQLAGILLAFNMLVATIWKITRGQKLVGGFELDLLLLSAGLVLATLGGGAYSLNLF